VFRVSWKETFIDLCYFKCLWFNQMKNYLKYVSLPFTILPLYVDINVKYVSFTLGITIMGAVSLHVYKTTHLSTTRKWNTTSFSTRRRTVEINVLLPVIVVSSTTTLKLHVHEKNNKTWYIKQVACYCCTTCIYNIA